MSDAHPAFRRAPRHDVIRSSRSQRGASVVAVIAVVAVALVGYLVLGGKKAGSTGDLGPQAVASRIMPVGAVALKVASGGGEPKTGEQVFQARCAACHAAGALGAPKFGDSAAWAPRIKSGYEALLNSAVKGKNSMSPQGGGEFSDYEIGRAVVYMANKGGANFPEPKAPAAK